LLTVHTPREYLWYMLRGHWWQGRSLRKQVITKTPSIFSSRQGVVLHPLLKATFSPCDTVTQGLCHSNTLRSNFKHVQFQLSYLLNLISLSFILLSPYSLVNTKIATAEAIPAANAPLIIPDQTLDDFIADNSFLI
jgi:hypothetical protein